MTTLKDILALNESVTLIRLDVRDSDRMLIKKVTIGKDYSMTPYLTDEQSKGRFEYIDADINRYGRNSKRGFSETTFGIDWKQIPKQYLDMEVDMINSLRERYGTDKGMELWATVIPIQIQMDIHQDDCQWK